jgi:hypothetical protein
MSCQRSVAIVALCAGLTAGLCGCNNARLVRWDGMTGEVAIPRNDNSWPEYNREKAEALIKEKCPRGYTIVHEEEVVTGQQHTTQVNTDRTNDPRFAGQPVSVVNTHTNETTTVADLKEFHITFRAADAPPMVPPGIVPTGAVVPVAPPPPIVSLPPQRGLPAQPIPVSGP